MHIELKYCSYSNYTALITLLGIRNTELVYKWLTFASDDTRFLIFPNHKNVKSYGIYNFTVGNGIVHTKFTTLRT